MTVHYVRLITGISFTFHGSPFLPCRHFLFKERNASPILTCLSLRVWANYLYGLSVPPRADRLLSCPLEMMHATHVHCVPEGSSVWRLYLRGLLAIACCVRKTTCVNDCVLSKTMYIKPCMYNMYYILCVIHMCVCIEFAFLCSSRFVMISSAWSLIWDLRCSISHLFISNFSLCQVQNLITLLSFCLCLLI